MDQERIGTSAWGWIALATIGFDGYTDIQGFDPDQAHHVETSWDNVRNWVLGSPLGNVPFAIR